MKAKNVRGSKYKLGCENARYDEDKSFFFAVGAAHLLEQGVILIEAGYTVKPI
jgi:hypothetical protein